MTWPFVIKRTSAVGVAGVVIATCLDALYQLLLAKPPSSLALELAQTTLYFALWPAAGILDGADSGGVYNWGAHMASWAWNGLIYAVIALMALSLLKLIRVTKVHLRLVP